MFAYASLLIISMILCGIPALQCVKKAGLFSIIFIMPVVSFIMKGISSIALDAGTFVSELGFVTWNVYSAPLYFLTLAVFFFFLNLFIGRRANRFCTLHSPESSVRSNGLLVGAIPVVGIMMAVYLILDMLISGIPLLSEGHITRFNYWSDYSKLPCAELISNFVTVECVALGFLYASSLLDRRASKRYITVIAILIATRFFLGYKISGIIDIVVGFSTGYITRRYTTSEMPTNSLSQALKNLLVIGVAAVFSYIVWQVASGSASTLGEAIEMLIDRQFSLSNHMWWSVINDTKHAAELLLNDPSELLSVF